MKTLLLTLFFSAIALSAAEAAGKWSGSFEAKNSKGELRAERAYLAITQDGQNLTGTGGPTADDQQGMLAGKVEGDQLTFTVEHHGQLIGFKLRIDGDSMKGDISSDHNGEKRTAVVTFSRVKN